MKLKDLVKSSGGSGSDLWMVPIELLDANPHNLRLDGPALREHIAGLAESIMAHGFLRSRPLTIRQNSGDRLEVVDGNCRLLAVRLAMQKGAEIKTLPCLSEAPHTNDAERTLNMLLANSGLQHTPMEYAAAIKRLLSYGWTDTDIAKKLGKSRQWVSNVLETAALPADVQAQLVDSVVSATQARKLVRQHGDKAAAVIAGAAAASGRKHVTARHLAAPVVATVAAAALPAPIAAITPYAPLPDAGLAGQVAAYDATQDALVTLRQAVRAYLAARAARPTDGDDIRAALAQLAELVGVQLGGIA